jgi:hypothetical protein
VRAAVTLAHDTVNLGLEHLSHGDRRQAVEVIRRRYLQHLFRVGWGLLHSLRRRAKRAEETLGLPSSFSEVEFLDTPYREALAGFLRPKPRYFEAIDARGQTGYRAFASLRDVDRAGEVVEDIAALPDLVVRFLGQSLPELATLRPSNADDFRLSAVLLTGFANSVLGRGPSLQPLDAEDLSRLRRATADSESAGLRTEVREQFLGSVGRTSGYLEFCLRRFEEEFLPIMPQFAYDPRYITCLMVATPAPPAADARR